MYFIARGSTSAGVFIILSRYGQLKKPIIPKTSPPSTETVKLVRAVLRRSVKSFAPKALPATTLHPIDKPKKNIVSRLVNVVVAPTPAKAKGKA